MLRPDVLAMHPLNESYPQCSSAGDAVSLLAVSSTLSDQIVVYRVDFNEVDILCSVCICYALCSFMCTNIFFQLEDKVQFNEVHHFRFPEEVR